MKIFTRNRVETIVIATMAAMWAAGYILLRWVFPQYSFPIYPAIPVTFLLLAFILVNLIAYTEKKFCHGQTTEQKAARNYLIYRIVKETLCIYNTAMYLLLDRYQTVPFLITVTTFYVVYFSLERFALMQYQRRHILAVKPLKQ